MTDKAHIICSGGDLEYTRALLQKRAAMDQEAPPKQAAPRTSSSLMERKTMFAERAAAHKNKMESNPFSGDFKANKMVALSKDDPNYGKPVAGSKSERRGLAAAARVNAEVAVLCDMIYQEGERDDDGTAVITFRDLFQIYTHISNKVVGMLLRARKHGLVTFEGEVLFQGRDDNKLIALLKPIAEIKAELADDTEFEVGVCHRSRRGGETTGGGEKTANT